MLRRHLYAQLVTDAVGAAILSADKSGREDGDFFERLFGQCRVNTRNDFPLASQWARRRNLDSVPFFLSNNILKQSIYTLVHTNGSGPTRPAAIKHSTFSIARRQRVNKSRDCAIIESARNGGGIE